MFIRKIFHAKDIVDLGWGDISYPKDWERHMEKGAILGVMVLAWSIYVILSILA